MIFMHTEESEEILRAKLNGETAQISWAELQRHFARGVVVKVVGELDIIEVALAMARDDKALFTDWMESGKVSRASDEDAIVWTTREPVFWSLVAAPFVLVQENPEKRQVHD